MGFLNKIELQTPESVELEFTLAGIGNRAYALIIDYIILGFTLFLSLVLTIFLNYQLNSGLGIFLGDLQNKFLQWLWAIEALVAFTIYIGYFVILETIYQGQTPGKKRIKIRVVSDDGKPVKLSQATLRALFRPIDDFFFIGVLFIVFGKKEQRIGDLIAGTIVIQDETNLKSADFPISDVAKDLAIQLRIEADIENLFPEDFATIRDYLQRRKQMILKYQHQLSRKLASQVREIINLEKIPDNYSNNQFLEAVYLAYQQTFSRE
ncbi:MAG: RDD family protein [Xenococcaceae cyanobacterium]